MDGMWEGVSRVRGHKYVYGGDGWDVGGSFQSEGTQVRLWFIRVDV